MYTLAIWGTWNLENQNSTYTFVPISFEQNDTLEMLFLGDYFGVKPCCGRCDSFASTFAHNNKIIDLKIKWYRVCM